MLWVKIGVHVLAAVVLAILWWTDGGRALVFLAPSALIGAASVRTVAGQPATLYCACGLLLGFGFWMLVSGVRQGDPVLVLLSLLVAAGGAWLLKDLDWPSLIFSSVVVALVLAFTLAMIPYGDEIGESARVRRMARLSFGVLLAGMAYAGAALAEVKLPARPEERPTVRKKRRPKVQREVAWDEDEGL